MDLGRNNASKIVQMELNDVKLMHTMYGKNCNMRHCPFIGCYCQRAHSFKLDHQCDAMADDEYVICQKNAVDEWEHELSVNDDYSIDNHKGWCAKKNRCE